MKQNNKKFNNAMHKFVGVLDKNDDVTTGTRDVVKEGRLQAVQGSMC